MTATRSRHSGSLGPLGAHVSIRGGVARAPARGRAIGANAIQIFTKSPNQWRDPVVTDREAEGFRKSLVDNKIDYVCAHDSYLINLASPDPVISARSITAFTRELERCARLGIEFLVSHPGNYIDDPDRGLEDNANRLARCLREVGGVSVLLELTAGTGTALGSRFRELARLRARVPPDVRPRVSYCADTCHLYSGGYDLRREYDGVWRRWERVLGLGRLGCLHLNDSRTALGSRRDRHELIAEGTLGAEPFRRLMRDPRFRQVPKMIETPKGEGEANDRRMLRRLRRFAVDSRRPATRPRRLP